MGKTRKQREIERAASAGPVVGHPLSKSQEHNALTRRVSEVLALWGVPFRVVVQAVPGLGHPTYGRDRLVDIIGAIPPTGRLFALELKTGRGVMKPGQIDFFDQFDAVGALCIEVRKMDDLGPLERAVVAGKQLRAKITRMTELHEPDPVFERGYMRGAEDAARLVVDSARNANGPA